MTLYCFLGKFNPQLFLDKLLHNNCGFNDHIILTLLYVEVLFSGYFFYSMGSPVVFFLMPKILHYY